jgi:signal transduction histidine kinase
MLATLSHDLKNPLSAVLVGAQNLLRLSLPEEAAPRIRRYAEAIQRAGQRMNDLLRDLLDLARLDDRTLPLEMKLHSVPDTVDLAVKPWTTAAAARRIDLRADVPDGLTILCDQRRIAQVIGNIVANAVRLSPEGSAVEISVQPRAGELLFTVRDEGPGIAAADLTKVLGPYWRGTENPRSGMGVGLPLAAAIVAAHHGRLWVESTEGSGSTFSFTLPTQ